MLCQGLEILGVEDDNSWEKKVFFECNKKKTAMNKQKFLKFT